MLTEYTYEPFGGTTASGPVSDNPLQYTGRENDETGLYYYRARYFSPSLQRFISEDPIGFNGDDINIYDYVGNNPINWIDPYGLYFGQMPPPPPGYDPSTWTAGQWDNGKWNVNSPDGRVYTAHPEDNSHWRHWDEQRPGSAKQRQWPPNANKRKPTQKKECRADQSAADPSGDSPEWAPPMNSLFMSPVPRSPMRVPESVPYRIPVRVPVPVW